MTITGVGIRWWPSRTDNFQIRWGLGDQRVIPSTTSFFGIGPRLFRENFTRLAQDSHDVGSTSGTGWDV